MKQKGTIKGNVIGRYRIEGNKVSDTWHELDDYITRSIEYIRKIFQYTESELLVKHEIKFFQLLKRADDQQRVKVQELEERKSRLKNRK